MYYHCCLCLTLSSRVGWLHGRSSKSFTSYSLCKSLRFDWNRYTNQLSIFIWELFPEWIFPLLTGFSIACLSAPNSTVVSQVFGGSNGNEGLGFLSISFDWQVSVNDFDVNRFANRGCYSIFLVLWTLWLFRSKHRYVMSFHRFCGTRHLCTSLDSSRISWATFFACGNCSAVIRPALTLRLELCLLLYISTTYGRPRTSHSLVNNQISVADYWHQFTYSFLNSCFTRTGHSTIKRLFSTPTTKSIPHFLLNKGYLIMPVLGLSICLAQIW